MINWCKNPDNTNYFLLSAEFIIKNARIITIFFEQSFLGQMDFKHLYHIHRKHEIFFVKQGEFIIKINDSDYILRDNSFIVIPAGVEHHVCSQSNNAQIFPVTVQFQKHQKHKNNPDIDLFETLNILFSADNKPQIFDECGEILKIFDVLLTAYKKIRNPLYDDYFEYEVIRLFTDVIYRIDANSLILKSKHDNTPAEKGRQFYTDIIEGFLSDLTYKKISLPELSERLQLSIRKTRRLIKHIYNIGFSELFTITRINIAKSMILETDLSVENISEQIGYSSNKSFFRAFQKVTNMTPAKFRKQYQYKRESP